MAKNIKALLEKKLAENQHRHADAVQTAEFDPGREYTKLAVDLIDPNPYQPRTTFPQDELDALASSIQENGLLQPIVVRQLGLRYQIIAGERRWRVHRQLGKRTIEALVSPATDDEMAVAALAENIDRADLSDFEIGKAIRQVEALFPTRSKLAEALGMNREDMYRYFAFDVLPDFVLERLKVNPRLLSRTAASDIKAMLTRENGSPAALDALRTALNLVEAKELDQTKAAEYVSRTLKGETIKDSLRNTVRLMKSGRAIGSITSDSRNLVIKLKTQAITEEQARRLREFLDELVAGQV